MHVLSLRASTCYITTLQTLTLHKQAAARHSKQEHDTPNYTENHIQSEINTLSNMKL